MNRSRLNSRSISIPSLLLALCLCLPAFAEEVPLRAYTASYNLHRGSLHIGMAEISLEPVEQLWRWRLTTRARGIYSLFIHKKPYSETTFSRVHDDVRLQKIVIGDEKDKDEYESASFNWEAGRMKVLRKGKRDKVKLAAGVYDYQSIHLLTAAMQRHQLDEETVDFYRKGKLVKSRLVYRGEETIDIGGRQIEAKVFMQTLDGSDNVIRYFYDADKPLLPLLIENRDGDDSPNILRLREVNWHL
ncbi:MAG: DUF3108 domain-containing protein [Gammaproteobacteria bacterium]|nr:DUF3108 domain-containing protein [Gammaproteobacteria bacterium]